MTKLIRRILRVDHAGEHGAVAIYSAQLWHARRRYPDLVPWLEETLSHERRHRQRFHEAMSERHVTPCGALAIWSVGGALLGACTAIFGRSGVYVCTAAVERTVHRHLVEQADYLDGADPPLSALIREVLTEEVAHLEYAEHRHSPETLAAQFLNLIVSSTTEALIWLSTQGATFRFKHDLRSPPA